MKNLLIENILTDMETTNTNVKKFNEIICKMADTYEKKNADYGDSFEQTCDEFGITAAIVRNSLKKTRWLLMKVLKIRYLIWLITL